VNDGPAAVLSALDDCGVQLAIGPFLVRVRSDLTGVRDFLERFYVDFPMRASDGGHFDVVIRGGRGVHRWVRPQATLALNGATPFLPLPERYAGPSLEWGLNWCVGNNAHQYVAVHAAVVERGGRALMLPAPPSSGKSTLCAALVSAGWRLLSDEFALIDPSSGRLLPIPRPVSLKDASIELIRRRNPTAVFGPEAEDIEGCRFVHMRPPADSVRRAAEPARPGWLIVPGFVAGRSTTLERLPKARALMHVAGQSFNYNYLGPTGYTCLAALIREAECYRLEYSDLDDVLALLDRLTTS
jgi:HprK-related kinase A